MSTQTASSTSPRTRRQPSRAARALGYAIAVVVNAVLLILVNVTPGWTAVPFVEPSAADVIPALNVALLVGIVGNVVNLIVDRRWMRAFTEILSSTALLVFIVMTWTVFPFAFDSGAIDWSLLTRVVLVVGAIGCGISIIVQLVTLAVESRRWSERPRQNGARS